jgi:hypothetical protein
VERNADFEERIQRECGIDLYDRISPDLPDYAADGYTDGGGSGVYGDLGKSGSRNV